MKLSPVEIKNQQFKKAFQGYDKNEVNNFLDAVAAQAEELLNEQRELTGKVAILETKLKDFQSMEKILHETLMQAQETSGKTVENARKEAQLIIQEAELKAAQLLDKSRNDLTSLKEHITILKAKKDSIVARLKMLLHSELDLIKALEVDEELQSNDLFEPATPKEKMEIEDIIKNLDK